jgi:hypothetical protein
MGSKDFTGGVPRTGRQRSAEQVTARLDDLLDFINAIFVFSDDEDNYGKVIGFDEVTGEIDVFSVLKYEGTVPEGNVLVADDEGDLQPEPAVIGDDREYTIGPDGTNGQIAVTDGNGNITFINPPASDAFVDQTGNFTATPGVKYNIDAGAQITIDTDDVDSSFRFSIRPKYGQDLTATPAVLLYNSVNPYENYTENVNVSINAEYEIYSQNGVNLQLTAKGVSING